MRIIRSLFRSRLAVAAALAAIVVETVFLFAAALHKPASDEGSAGTDAGYPDDESRLAAEALARRKTVSVAVEDPTMLFPGDDSLTAQFWRRYNRADGLYRDAMTQFDMNVASDQAERSLEWMIKAMIAELRVINENDPAFIKAMDASQKAWDKFYKKQLTMRYPDKNEDMGSSTAMVYHNAAIPICMARVRELMPWYMGVDSSGGQWMGIGSLWYDSDIALRKEALQKAGRLPLKPADIGVEEDVAYGDEYLKAMDK
jgi:hypothetical protein